MPTQRHRPIATHPDMHPDHFARDLYVAVTTTIDALTKLTPDAGTPEAQLLHDLRGARDTYDTAVERRNQKGTPR